MFEELPGILFGASYVVLGVVILLLAKIAKDVLTPFSIDEELTQKDNPALGFAIGGYFAAVIIIYLGAAVGEYDSATLTAAAAARMIGVDALWAIGGLIALNLTRTVVDKALLPQFSMQKEIIDDRNVGAAVIEGGSLIATALVVAGALSGVGGGPLTALAFFVLGQVVLVVFARVYQLITRYDLHEEIERDNVAAGVAFGLSLIAIGILMCRATVGDFVGWAENLSDFGYYAGVGFLLLIVLRKMTDALLLPKRSIADEIAEDRNVNAALVEGVVAMGVATIAFFML